VGGREGRYLVATFAGLELLVSDVHLLGAERAGAVSVVAHGHPTVPRHGEEHRDVKKIYL
jgi:hypothetical protein